MATTKQDLIQRLEVKIKADLNFSNKAIAFAKEGKSVEREMY